MQKLKIDNAFFSLMDRIGDLVILNILWTVFCLPVITIGAATTAMCAVTMKISAGEDPVIAHTFFKAFKENFKQSTLTFLIFLAAGVLLLIDFLAAPTFPNVLGPILMIGSVAFGILYFWTLIYVFPVQLTFHEGLQKTVRRSLITSFQNLPYTLVISSLVLIPVCISFVLPELAVYLSPFFLFIGSSCIALGSSWFYNRIFAKNNQEDSL